MEDLVETVALAPKDEEHLFLKEMMHRVNNEFASAVSIISIRAARSTNRDVKVALNEAINQLMSFASVHKALQVPASNMIVDASAYLRRLCFAISNAKLRSKGIQLVLSEMEPLLLRADKSWTLGLIVSELITNASHHAFGITKGTIRIELLNGQSCVKWYPSGSGRLADELRV